MIFFFLVHCISTFYECNHASLAHEIDLKPPPLHRLLQESQEEFRPLKMVFHFVNSSHHFLQELVGKVVFPQIQKYLEATFKVKGPRKIDPFTSTVCDKFI